MTQVYNYIHTYLFTAVMVRFEKERYTVNEGAGSVALVLLISHPNNNDITVLYSTKDRSARGTCM